MDQKLRPFYCRGGFAYWWSFSGVRSAINGATPSSLFYFGQSGGASRGRVFYQWGLSCLVLKECKTPGVKFKEKAGINREKGMKLEASENNRKKNRKKTGRKNTMVF